jgi:hypothetical protein
LSSMAADQAIHVQAMRAFLDTSTRGIVR